VRADLEAGQLVAKQVLESKPGMPLLVAWRTGNKGKALVWFLDQLEDGKLLASLLA
jgi:hypothetical protein